jgi:hypothetical protein
MKILAVAAFVVVTALGGVLWFVSKGDAPGERSAAEVLEPEMASSTDTNGEAAVLADPEADPSGIDLAASTSAIEAKSGRVAGKQIFGRVVPELNAQPAAPDSAAPATSAVRAPVETPASEANPDGAAAGDAAKPQGIASISVHLMRGEEVLGTTVTTEDGHFAFPLVDRGELTITVDERPNWQVLDVPRVLQPEQQSGDAEVILQARSLRSAPLTGIVLDARTREFLPRYMLRLEDEAGHRVQELTDDQGQFTTKLPLASGVVHVVPLDHERRGRPVPTLSIEHDASAARPTLHEIRVESGPTFRLAVSPAKGPDPAALIARVRWPTEDGSRAGDFEPVRAVEPYAKPGEAPWVRLPPLDPAIEATEALEVRTSDGLWLGEGQVTAVLGVVTSQVDVKLMPFSSVSGVVTDSSGAPVRGADVSLEYVAVNGKPGGTRSSRSDRSGHYRLDFTRPGAVTVRVKTIAYAAAETQLTLVSGEAAHADFVLEPLPVAGSIRGLVTSDTGKYEPDDVRVTLVNVGIPGPRLRTRPQWETRLGKRVGVFAFDGLPAGNYRVEIDEHDWFEWEPRALQATAPRDGLEFRAHDAVRVADLVFRVTDSDNGLSIDKFHVFTQGYPGSGSSTSSSGQIFLANFRLDLRMRWRLDKAGYPPVFGTLASFNVETLADGRVRHTAEINLRPGWGDRLHVVRRNGQKPIANAAVLVNGMEVARTDSNGIANISVRDKPKSVTVTFPGWQQVGTVDLRPPAKRGWKMTNDVQMQPAPKQK